MKPLLLTIASLAMAACSGAATPPNSTATTPVASGPSAAASTVAAASAVATSVPPTATTSPPALVPGPGATWSVTTPPAGSTVAGGTWIRIPAPGGKTILAEVFRPSGQGPWPVVVFLHGQSGLANVHLRTGAELARSGFVTVVGCWFAGNYDGASAVDPPPPQSNPDGVACPDGPPIKLLRSQAAIDDVSALVAAAKTLPDVTPRLGLVGYSRGWITTVLTSSGAPGTMHAAAALAGAPPVPATGGPLSQAITAPLLLLQGDADEVLPVQNSRNLESALRALGKPVQAYYFPGASHGFLFEPQWHADAMARLVAFLQTSLKP